jgi:hypothetical protein
LQSFKEEADEVAVFVVVNPCVVLATIIVFS